MKESEKLFNEIQSSSDICLMSETEMFFGTNHDDGNLNKKYEFIPVSGISRKAISGIKKLSFEDTMDKTTFGDIECAGCPFLTNVTYSTYKCSLLDNSIPKPSKTLKNFTQVDCPIKQYRKNNSTPKSFTDIECL